MAYAYGIALQYHNRHTKKDDWLYWVDFYSNDLLRKVAGKMQQHRSEPQTKHKLTHDDKVQ